jgi:hypothetical protein
MLGGIGVIDFRLLATRLWSTLKSRLRLLLRWLPRRSAVGRPLGSGLTVLRRRLPFPFRRSSSDDRSDLDSLTEELDFRRRFRSFEGYLGRSSYDLWELMYLSPLSRLALFGESDRSVDIVDTESVEREEMDLDLLRAWDMDGGGLAEGRSNVRPRCSAFFASCSSAMPSLLARQQILQLSLMAVRGIDRGSNRCKSLQARLTYLRSKSFGTSLVSFGASFGFSNCCVREGLETYGLSWADALHS